MEAGTILLESGRESKSARRLFERLKQPVTTDFRILTARTSKTQSRKQIQKIVHIVI